MERQSYEDDPTQSQKYEVLWSSGVRTEGHGQMPVRFSLSDFIWLLAVFVCSLEENSEFLQNPALFH